MTDRRPSPAKRSPYPSTSRRTSPTASRRKPKEDRMPIKFISIEVEIEDEQRDDEEINVLVSLIKKRDWAGVSSRLQIQEGINEASRALATNDYALHMICRCGEDHKVSKYKSFKGATSSKTGDSSSSGDLSSREESSFTGSTPSGSSESITTKEPSESTPRKETFPTKAVLEAVINAFPKATKLRGSDDATPLHWAVRHRYPTELLDVLIRAFPQALELKDAATRTVRSYTPIVDNPTSRSSLLRPISCWLQHTIDERVAKIMAKETVALEKEVAKLLKSLEAAKGEEANLQKRVINMEAELNSYGDLTLVRGFASKASEIHNELEGSIDVLRGTLEGLVGQTMIKYAEEEKERALVASFNSDVERIYNNADQTIDEMKSDLEKVARVLKETKGFKK